MPILDIRPLVSKLDELNGNIQRLITLMEKNIELQQKILERINK